MVVFSSDNLVVSHYLGAAEVTPYSVTWRLVGLAALLQSLIFPALWPAYAEAYARRDYALDTAKLLADHERHGRIQSALRGCAGRFWSNA